MKMSKTIVLAGILLVASTSLPGTASGQGDYCIHISNGSPDHYDQAVVGMMNTLEIWIANDDWLGGMSPAVEIGFDTDREWNLSYGDFLSPAVQHGKAIGAFDGAHVCIHTFTTPPPDSLLIGGAANSEPPTDGMPPGPSELCYTLQFFIPEGEAEIIDGICIRPIFWPPARTWTFAVWPEDPPSYGYPPDFCGQSTLSEIDPVADPVCFDIIHGEAPVFTVTPDSPVIQDHCDGPYSFQFEADEGGNDPPADPVVFSGDYITADGYFNAPVPDTWGCHEYTVTATNAEGWPTDFTFTIDWASIRPQITQYPVGIGEVCTGLDWEFQFAATDGDACDTLRWTVMAIGDEPVGAYSIDGSGLFTFTPDGLDGGLVYEFGVWAVDNVNRSNNVYFYVETLACQPFLIKLEKAHNTLQGHYEFVSVISYGSSWEMAGYDLLVGYDASALTFISADLGEALGPDGCGWEYFTYRHGAFGNCSGPCPSGFVRLVSIADINNGANHPGCFYVPSGENLATMKFYVTNNRIFECQYIPIRFVWQDCGDNGLASPTGDTLFISQRVLSYEWDGDFGTIDEYDITGFDCDSSWGFYYGGACDWCDVSDKVTPIRLVIFWNGGVDIVCADSIDLRGDINLNGVYDEIADAVLFTNYFLYGIGVFHIALEGQIAATDVNHDGLVLSVGDLVYLIRIITGDALPFVKLAPYANSVNVTQFGGTLSANTGVDIGALFAVFDVDGDCDVVNLTEMELVSNEVNGELRVLLYSGLENLTNRIPAGESTLFTVNGDARLLRVEASDYHGNLLATNVSTVALPKQYCLHQNTPNPFNPTTKISFELPTISDWSLGIYNVAGQIIDSFSGSDRGVVVVEWNASKVASGVYFYKLTVGTFSDTKKMVLMK